MQRNKKVGLILIGIAMIGFLFLLIASLGSDEVNTVDVVEMHIARQMSIVNQKLSDTERSLRQQLEESKKEFTEFRTIINRERLDMIEWKEKIEAFMSNSVLIIDEKEKK